MNKEFWTEVESLIVHREPETLEYRFHYNDGGEIYMCSMIDHPKDTAYIVVTKEVYDRYFDYQVVEGQLKRIVRDSGYHVQLQNSDVGYRTLKNHANILLEETENYPHQYVKYRDH
jgi:hypothetical protein